MATQDIAPLEPIVTLPTSLLITPSVVNASVLANALERAFHSREIQHYDHFLSELFIMVASFTATNPDANPTRDPGLKTTVSLSLLMARHLPLPVCLGFVFGSNLPEPVSLSSILVSNGSVCVRLDALLDTFWQGPLVWTLVGVLITPK